MPSTTNDDHPAIMSTPKVQEDNKHIYATVEEYSTEPEASSSGNSDSKRLEKQISKSIELGLDSHHHHLGEERICTPEMTKRTAKEHKKWNRRLKIFFCCLGYKKNKVSFAQEGVMLEISVQCSLKFLSLSNMDALSIVSNELRTRSLMWRAYSPNTMRTSMCPRRILRPVLCCFPSIRPHKENG